MCQLQMAAPGVEVGGRGVAVGAGGGGVAVEDELVGREVGVARAAADALGAGAVVPGRHEDALVAPAALVTDLGATGRTRCICIYVYVCICIYIYI